MGEVVGFPAAEFCRRCGRQSRAGDAFCRACGERLAPEHPAARSRQPAPQAAPAQQGTWAPSHLVPLSGMQAWATPDPALPAVASLEPGLSVQVVEQSGAWARVQASNGWTGWVDARSLLANA